jgi:CheY-like chemotaxis protein
MNLDSLLVCSDDRALRILRNVLGELEIHVEHCADHVSAAKRLAQHSFEAVIIDCKDEHSFGLLTRVRSGQQNRKSLAIAIIRRAHQSADCIQARGKLRCLQTDLDRKGKVEFSSCPSSHETRAAGIPLRLSKNQMLSQDLCVANFQKEVAQTVCCCAARGARTTRVN